MKLFTIQFSFIALGLLALTNCTKKQPEVVIPAEVDTTKYQKVDSIVNVIPRSALRDTILTISDDSVFALYYPNTGKVVMKLKKGDVCNITRTGRYDVVDGRGNFWIRVERFGGKGWIFGGQTSIASDVWVFSDGMTELGHPYLKYKLNRITASNFSDFFQAAGEEMEKNEYSESDDETGNRKVDYNDDEIVVNEDDGLDTKITETYKPGPARDSIWSINYSYSEEGDKKVAFNHAFIISGRGPRLAFVADFFGHLKEIHRIGSNYVLISDYDLSSSDLGAVHYTNVEVWSPAKKHIIKRHRYSNSAVETTGFPIFKPWEDGSFISNSKCTFAEVDGKLGMEIFETYNRLNNVDKVDEKIFYITRYFTFNDVTNQFDETKQEVIYQAK